MVYDCVMFLNEVDLLEIRMSVLSDVVDRFVIVEANTTQMGEVRTPVFEKYKDRFKKFEDRTIYYICDNKDMEFKNQWERERFQKDSVINAIKDASDDDLFLYSDLDEIPDPVSIRQVLDGFDPEAIYHFAQRMFNFYINYENVGKKLLAASGDLDGIDDPMWIGTRMCTVGKAREVTVDGLRSKDRFKEKAIRVDNGGWHFSYMGGDKDPVNKRVKDKLGSFSHDEYNNPRLYSRIHIWRKILTGSDFLGRDAKFSKVRIDDTYPEWLREHYREYPHLVL